MQGDQAGRFDRWPVHLLPRPGIASPPLSVVVPARDSLSAGAEAARRDPGLVVGPVSRLSRKW